LQGNHSTLADYTPDVYRAPQIAALNRSVAAEEEETSMWWVVAAAVAGVGLVGLGAAYMLHTDKGKKDHNRK
jgi:hypothetical protein